jgi:hypothetical protein
MCTINARCLSCILLFEHKCCAEFAELDILGVTKCIDPTQAESQPQRCQFNLPPEPRGREVQSPKTSLTTSERLQQRQKARRHHRRYARSEYFGVGAVLPNIPSCRPDSRPTLSGKKRK